MNKKQLFLIVLTGLFFLVGCNNNTLISEQDVLSLLETSLITSNTKLQDQYNWGCATNHSEKVQSFERNLNPFSIQALMSNQYCVQIAFYIVRNSDGTGGYNPANIPAILRQINDSYNSQNIYFFSEGIRCKIMFNLKML